MWQSRRLGPEERIYSRSTSDLQRIYSGRGSFRSITFCIWGEGISGGGGSD